MDKYLSGELLYGDDFSQDEISEWYADEAEGYANLGAADSGHYKYVYHALNWHHAYRHIKLSQNIRVLGFGSAYGEELLPLLEKTDQLTIIDPSDAFLTDNVRGVPCRYVKPVPSGALPFEDNAFDVATAFGVLHHVPNVTAVVTELSRVVKAGGYLLLREPIVSMGDWRHPRHGLTKRERGIPLDFLRNLANASGFEVEREGLCVFPPMTKLGKLFRNDPYNSRMATMADHFLSHLFAWNVNYHPQSLWQKIRPTSVFYVLRKLPETNETSGKLT